MHWPPHPAMQLWIPTCSFIHLPFCNTPIATVLNKAFLTVFKKCQNNFFFSNWASCNFYFSLKHLCFFVPSLFPSSHSPFPPSPFLPFFALAIPGLGWTLSAISITGKMGNSCLDPASRSLYSPTFPHGHHSQCLSYHIPRKNEIITTTVKQLGGLKR